MTDRTISPPWPPLAPAHDRGHGDPRFHGGHESEDTSCRSRISRPFSAALQMAQARRILRRYQLHMRSSGASATAMNASVSALRFLFGGTLGRGDANPGMTTPARAAQAAGGAQPRGGRAPSRCGAKLEPRGLKSRAALSLAYGAGLRASEVVSLKLPDIDSSRMAIRVEQGKGGKDRYATRNIARARDRGRRHRRGHQSAGPRRRPWRHCGGPMISIETFERG